MDNENKNFHQEFGSSFRIQQEGKGIFDSLRVDEEKSHALAEDIHKMEKFEGTLNIPEAMQEMIDKHGIRTEGEFIFLGYVFGIMRVLREGPSPGHFLGKGIEIPVEGSIEAMQNIVNLLKGIEKRAKTAKRTKKEDGTK